MFRGSVDAVTRDTIWGWAAVADRPDAVAEISIFISGRKIAQVACDAPRADLKRLGTFGEGAHGFRFNLPEPLPRDKDHSIAIRFSETGQLLQGGDVVLHIDDTVEKCSRRHDWSGEPELIPAPRNPRDLFERLALCEETASVYELLRRLDFRGVSPAEAPAIVFGGAAMGPSIGDKWSGNSPTRDYVNELLLSSKFQADLIPLFLNAFAEKQRLIFVHVPKCAGTDLSVKLTARYPSLHKSLTDVNWTTTEELFKAISRLVINIRFFDEILISGHNPLGYYIANDLIRLSDCVFTVVRDPIKIAESQTNYVMTRLMADTKSGNFAPDTREWLDQLGLDKLPVDLPPAKVQQLCSAILRCPEIVRSNSMCFWLGGDTADRALALLAACRVEVTVADRYSEWLRKRWGIEIDSRLNISEKFISPEIMHDALPHLRQLLAEDIKLYSCIYRTIQRSGKVSVMGPDLVETLRSQVADR